MDYELQDKFRGTLLGAAVGDALGAPYEFKHRDSANLNTKLVTAGYAMGCFGTSPGSPTDDSTLTRLHAEALLAMGSPSTYRPHYMRRARRWQLSGPPDIGGQTSSALSTWGHGEEYPVARESAAGNGSLMAVSPVALVAKNAISAALLGEKFAGFTHPSGAAKFANRQYAAALWALSRGVRPEIVLQTCRIPRPLGMATDGGSMGFCLISAALAFEAVQAVENGLTPFEALVTCIVENGGDTDTNGCIAGALLGAAYGQSAWESGDAGSAPGWVLDDLADYDNWLDLADQLQAKYTPDAALGLAA